MIFITIITSRENNNANMINLSSTNLSVEEVDIKYIYFYKKGGIKQKIVGFYCLVDVNNRYLKNKNILSLIPICL